MSEAPPQMTELGLEVPVGAIEKELKTLWEADEARTNASLMNLAIYSEDAAALGRNSELIGELTRDSMIWFWDHYTGSGDDRFSPYASLLRADDLAGLPDTTIIAAEYDPLVDEAVAYGEALQAAGVKTRCTVYDGMIHGFNGRVGMYDAAKDALDEAAAGIKQSFGG